MSEIMLGNLERTARFDAEFFAQEHRSAVALMAKQRLESLREVASISDGNHFGISEDFCDDGVPYYRGQDVVGHFFVEQSDCMKITREAYDEPTMVRSHLRRGDVLLSIIGSIGEASLVSSDKPATCSCKLAILRPLTISAEYLAAFLRSKFGRSQNYRMTRGAVQMGLLLEDTDQIFVPRFSKAVEEGVCAQVCRAKLEFEKSAAQLTAAEETLLHTLGLDAWQPPEPLTYVRHASQVAEAVRLDAEHFKPKFDDLIAHLMAGGDAVRLDRVLSFCERGRQPTYADEGVVVVNSRHVRTDTVILDGENRIAMVEDETLLIRHGDILLNGTGVGTIGRVTTYLHDTPALPDNHVTILRLHPESGFDPVFLAVQLAGVVGQTQVEQHTRGSSGQLELYPQDIRRILVWRAPKEMQLAVRKYIEAAHAARREAQALLARAQRAVEVAIEQGEPAALNLLTRPI